MTERREGGRWIAFGAGILALTAATAAWGQTPTVIPVDGKPFQAQRLVDADHAWNLTFEANGAQRSIAAADLVRWGNPARARRTPVLVFWDGSLLVADVFEADDDTLTVDSSLFGFVKLPRAHLAGVVLALPSELAARDALFDRIARGHESSDRVLLANNDEIPGQLVGLDEKSLRFQTELKPLDVPVNRVRAIIFRAPAVRGAEAEALSVTAGFDDGSRLVVQRLAVHDTSLELAAAGRIAWATKTDRLVYLQPSGGRAVYLSDRQPDDDGRLPYLSLEWPYRLDHATSGSRLRAAGRLYPKGIGMHATSRVTYRLDEAYQAFQAEVAIDEAVDEGLGSVRFRVYVDGASKFVSPIVRGGQSPISVTVDLTDAKRLDLVVDFADWADVGDHADWLDARLIRGAPLDTP